MRRGGPLGLILVVFFVIVVLGIGAAVFLNLIPGLSLTGSPASVTAVPVEKVLVAAQKINKDQEITDDLLTTIDLPKNFVVATMMTDKALLVGKYAAYSIEQGLPFSVNMVAQRPGTGGANVISPGQVAISVPAKRTDLVGFGIKDGDHVDVIATTLFVDIDASFQSELPNSFGQVVNIGSAPDGAPLAVLGMNNGGSGSRFAGRAELDPTLNQVIYFTPSEAQRPRLVSQMILQDIQVLHVGNFSLTGAAPSAVQPTPDAAQSGGQAAPTAAPVVAEPEIITLIVSPQDAISLTYLQYSGGTKLTFALRAPDDQSRAETEAATLQYILSQYAIPIPAKLPYGMVPHLIDLPMFDIKVTATPRP